jgi:hypothetical protein
MTDLLDSLAKPPPPPSELDELMSRDPLNLSAQDIDSIIAYQRQQRARREAGGKTKRLKAGDAPSGIDLVSLVTKQAPKPPSPTSVPGVVNSLRRI